GQLLLVHVLEEEVLGLGVLVRGVGVDIAEVVGERADVVVVVLGPPGEVVALELAVGPGLRERGVLGLAPLDRLLERDPELVLREQLCQGVCPPSVPPCRAVAGHRPGVSYTAYKSCGLQASPRCPRSRTSWRSWPSSAPGVVPGV